MCKTFPVLIAALLLSACHSARKPPAPAEPRPKRAGTGAVAPGSGERTSVRPVQAVNGRIVVVREALRFVVVDFGAGKMPKLEQRLWAYRLDQKVAELKVSGPYLGTTVAADVTAGEAREGDLVREQ